MDHDEDELVCFVARALAEAEGYDPDGLTQDKTTNHQVPIWETYRRVANRHIVAANALARFAIMRMDGGGLSPGIDQK